MLLTAGRRKLPRHVGRYGLAAPRPARPCEGANAGLGGEDDGHFNLKAFRATARAYNTVVETFPQMGHNMMLEPGWADVAERIDTWLTARGL